MTDYANSNNGTMQNGVTTVPGKVGNAFSFDGVDDEITVPYDIRDHRGEVIHAAGTTVNPLEHMTLSRRLLLSGRRNMSPISGYATTRATMTSARRRRVRRRFFFSDTFHRSVSGLLQ